MDLGKQFIHFAFPVTCESQTKLEKKDSVQDVKGFNSFRFYFSLLCDFIVSKKKKY